MGKNLNVREIAPPDVDLIADYWLKSDPDFMVSMGVDLAKLPSRENLVAMVSSQFDTAYNQKKIYALIWEIDGKPVGHSNLNNIQFGKEAYMHLHLWQQNFRRKGAGTEFIKLSLPFYFRNFKLDVLYCEPYALNPAPNKTLEKVGFEFEKKYVTVPGSLNFEQEVNRWKMTRENFEYIAKQKNQEKNVNP